MADFPTPFLYTSSSEIPTLSYTRTVADPELHIGGWGGGGASSRSSGPVGHPALEIRGSGEGLKKIFFRPLGPQFSRIWSCRVPRAPLLHPPLPKLEKDIPFGRNLLV